jgi:uncharacterized protein (TIGR00299 family) protein
MFLGALIDMGWPLASLQRELGDIGIRDIRLEVETRVHRQLASKGIVVSTGEKNVHRHLPDIEKLLGVDAGGDRPVPAHRRRAHEAFRRLVAAEARVHGQPVERVHLHEVGALDSIADILGVCLAVSELEIDEVVSAPLPLGTGWVEMAHGRFPVPAPATVEILKEIPVVWTGEEGEKVTPTGAVLAATLAGRFGVPPPMTVKATGWGGGSRPSGEGQRPNLVRLILGETQDKSGEWRWERIGLLTANVDDMTPEQLAHLTEMLWDAGALDVFVVPGAMKKGRPAWTVSVMAEADRVDNLRDKLFEESSTLGIRFRWEDRWILDRRPEAIDTAYGTIQVKWSRRGGRWEAAPEHESLKAAAKRHGIPLRRLSLEILRQLPDRPKSDP